MAATLTWTTQALRQLDEIRRYIAEHSPTYARRTVERIRDRARVLKKHPRHGRAFPGHDDESIREVFWRAYRILYCCRDNDRTILILAVVHGSRQFDPRWLSSE